MKERLHCQLRLLQADSWFQPRKRPEHAARARPLLSRFIQRLGNEQICSRQRRQFEITWQNAGNRGGQPIQKEGPSTHVLISSKTALPESVGQKDHARCIGPVVFERKVTAQQRLNTQRAQEVGFHLRASRAHGSPVGQVAVVDAAPGSEGFQRCLLPPPFDVVGTQHELLRLDGCDKTQRNQPLFLWIGETTKQDAVNHTEHRRGRANSKSERQHGCQSKSRILEKNTNCVAKIGHHKDFVIRVS